MERKVGNILEVFRFMSEEEFEKFKKGEILQNNKKHTSKTNSVGFCFLDLKDYKPYKAMHFLSGIVSFDVCAIFEVDRNKLKQTWGVYAKPIAYTGNFLIDLLNLYNDYEKKFTATEYCTTKYNNKDFKLINYSKNLWKQYDKLEEQKELNWIKSKED